MSFAPEHNLLDLRTPDNIHNTRNNVMQQLVSSRSLWNVFNPSTFPTRDLCDGMKMEFSILVMDWDFIASHSWAKTWLENIMKTLSNNSANHRATYFRSLCSLLWAILAHHLPDKASFRNMHFLRERKHFPDTFKSNSTKVFWVFFFLYFFLFSWLPLS